MTVWKSCSMQVFTARTFSIPFGTNREGELVRFLEAHKKLKILATPLASLLSLGDPVSCGSTRGEQSARGVAKLHVESTENMEWTIA